MVDPMKRMQPYSNESESLQVDGLTIENRTDRVAIYGSLHLTRDKAGLTNAQFLKQLLEDVVQALEQDHNLPEKVALANAPRAAKNPFS